MKQKFELKLQPWNADLVPRYSDQETTVYMKAEADKVIEHYKQLADVNVKKIKEELKNHKHFQDMLSGISKRIIGTKAEEPEFYFKWKDVKNLTPHTIYEWFKALRLYSSSARIWEEQERGSTCVVERVRDNYLLEKCKELLDNLKRLK